MNKYLWKQRLQKAATPVILLLLGVILILNPDYASAIVGKVLGWILVAVATVQAILAFMDKDRLFFRAIPAIVCLGVGVWLMNNPLALASALGRLVGILVTVRGIQDILHALEWRCSMSWAVVATVLGVLLVAMPMTASRIVFILCGVAVILNALVMLYDRFRPAKPSAEITPDENTKDIIDVQ